ncbi:hypothetical protein NSE01_33920 [Novosphingobium sediminis]|uniref:Sulfotransferase n=1 Tax=Novosphingobium sediminis TaxID=707214 RepID=A0A512APC4_9SPHN|nr:sulfotransferase [Novosphingobium sediminis]GEO01560.1 hypothetical protein NSE01_33920 [Novosphingobium sediminis]
MIAGLPRSGTTHLVNMLAADPRLRSSQLWEMCFPFPLPGEQPGPIEQSPRFEMTKEMWKNNNVVLPYMAAIHEMHPDHVHENIEFQGMDFSSYQIEWRARVPRWSHYYFAHDQTPHYAYEKKMMQALTWMRGPNRWLTKAPPNMENLIPLHTVFPDATIVITHRDPVAVIRSSLTLLAYWVDDFASVIARAAEDGVTFDIVQEFIDPEGTAFEIYVERAGQPNRILAQLMLAGPVAALYDGVRDAALGWDGSDPIRDALDLLGGALDLHQS